MRNNDDQETVASFDLLVPGMGELIGGSQREERHDVLLHKIESAKLNPADYSWYLDTRRYSPPPSSHHPALPRYGTIPHAGYGLGFERLICLVTSMENIRDAIPFPRYPGTADN
jgi:asparaginyl-tRNA synthetase